MWLAAATGNSYGALLGRIPKAATFLGSRCVTFRMSRQACAASGGRGRRASCESKRLCGRIRRVSGRFILIGHFLPRRPLRLFDSSMLDSVGDLCSLRISLVPCHYEQCVCLIPVLCDSAAADVVGLCFARRLTVVILGVTRAFKAPFWGPFSGGTGESNLKTFQGLMGKPMAVKGQTSWIITQALGWAVGGLPKDMHRLRPVLFPHKEFRQSFAKF
jgi:hypothetical protein